MTEDELEKSYLKVQHTKEHFVEYMREQHLTPSEGITVVAGLLMTMYDLLSEKPTVDGFIDTFGSIYKVHHALQHQDATPTLQ